MYERNDRMQTSGSHRSSRMHREKGKKRLPTHVKESEKKKKTTLCNHQSHSTYPNIERKPLFVRDAAAARVRTAKYESRIIALVSEFREIASSIRGWSFLISCPGCARTPQRRGQGTRSREEIEKTYDGRRWWKRRRRGRHRGGILKIPDLTLLKD